VTIGFDVPFIVGFIIVVSAVGGLIARGLQRLLTIGAPAKTEK
jgi:hypothetical protein